MSIRRWIALFITLLTVPGLALAEIRLEGQVAPGQVYTLLAPADGRIASVTCAPGDRCGQGGEAVLFLETVYRAPQDGTVVYIPAHKGESAQALAERYGGAMLLSPAEKGVVSGSVRKNYPNDVSSGQTVFLRSASGGNEGHGVLVFSGGDMVTIHVTDGAFSEGEKVNFYAVETLEASSQMGSGTFSAAPECRVSGTGYIAGLLVSPGDAVQTGDPLFSTLPYPAQDTPVFAGTGVVLDVFVRAGDQVMAGQPLVSYCLTDELVIQAEAAEYALPCLTADTAYAVLIPALGTEGSAALASIGSCPTGIAGETAYPASFLPEALQDKLLIGMTAYIVIPDEPEQAEEAP